MSKEMTEFDPGAKIRSRDDHQRSLQQKLPYPVGKYENETIYGSVEEYIAEYNAYPDEEFDYLDENITEFDPGAKLRASQENVMFSVR